MKQPGAHHVSGGNPDSKEKKIGVTLAPIVTPPPRFNGSDTSRTKVGGKGKHRLEIARPAAAHPGAVSVVNSRKASTIGLKLQSKNHDEKTERSSEKYQHRLELASSSSPPDPIPSTKGGGRGGGDVHDKKMAANETGLQLAASVGPPNNNNNTDTTSESESSRQRIQERKGLALAPLVDPAAALSGLRIVRVNGIWWP